MCESPRLLTLQNVCVCLSQCVPKNANANTEFNRLYLLFLLLLLPLIFLLYYLCKGATASPVTNSKPVPLQVSVCANNVVVVVSSPPIHVCKGTMILTFENPLDEGRIVVVTICKACVGCEVMLGLFYLKT